MIKPKVSIITPSFNSVHYIRETYHSIYSQTYTKWEWLIIDDGSNDNSIEIIQTFSKKDPRIKLFKRKSINKGASVCRNIGIDKSTGDFLVFLDADDLLAFECLENRLKLIDKYYPNLDFAVFKMGYLKHQIGDREGTVNFYADNQEEYLNMFIRYELPWAITCPLWRKNFLIENNIRFSEKYQRLQDPEFHLRILLKCNPRFVVDEYGTVDCYYRISENKPKKKSSLIKITDSFSYYISDLFQLHKEVNILDFSENMKLLARNVYRTLLFNYNLPNFHFIIKIYATFKMFKIKNNHSLVILWLFYVFNRTRLTFTKGVGITRLWKIIYEK